MSFKAILNAIFALALAISQALLLALPSPAQNVAQGGAFTIKLLVRRGDPVLEGGAFFDCRSCEGGLVGNQSINNFNNVLVWGEDTGSCSAGRYIAFERSGQRVVDSCQTTPFGKLEAINGGV